MTLNIRLMTFADLAVVNHIEKSAHISPWSEGILRDCLSVAYEFWVAEENAEIVGYGIMRVAADEAHIFNLCVKPDCQRRGHGRALLQWLLAIAKEKQAKMVILEVRASNKAALTLYEQLSFNEIGIRKDYYPAANGREDAIMLALDTSII